MKGNIRDVANVGLVHHLLYTACTEDPVYHAETLEKFVKRDDIDAFDFCVPYSSPERENCVEAVKNSHKDKAYSLHLFPARKLSLGTLDLAEKEIIKIILKDQAKQAALCGAKDFVFVSGEDNTEKRHEAMESFYNTCLWFCELLSSYGITALLEPFDRFVDKKFLFGSIDECVELVKRVSEKHDNIGIELDIAHLPLMGEDIESSIHRCGNYIKRVHLGNCVLKDKSSPWYGDIHPPMEFPGGEIGLKELKTALSALRDIGYFDGKKKGLVLEMRPFDGEATIEKTISDSFSLLERAWREI